MDLFILLNAHLHFTMRHNIKTKSALQKYMAVSYKRLWKDDFDLPKE